MADDLITLPPGSDKRLSCHFTAREFRCHGTGQKGHASHPILIAPRLLWLLELTRHHLQKPIVLLSAHRCAWWNEQQEGAPRSYHVDGYAADLATGVLLFTDAVHLGWTGVGTRGPWATHIDARRLPGNWVSHWEYT